MLSKVLDGFSDKINQAIQASDYDELRLLDAACLRFMSENLPAQGLTESELQALNESLNRLQVAYRSAVKTCVAAQSDIQKELHNVGVGRRNTHQYLDVARNLGS